ncbi:MAG: ATP-dependent helicase [Acidobacteria bacterium]|nr:ATP-dependent helicase [Acidobacteriota bacterium]
MAIRFLINDDCSPFDSGELDSLREQLDLLSSDERTEFRNQNALALAEHKAQQFLIVSGPGTGKSTLFLSRIINWLNRDETATIFVTSFVRKLVADLQNDISREARLTENQQKNITASTLHKLARSIVEKNHGTATWPFKPHFKLIAQFWKEIVWQDVIDLQNGMDIEAYPWKGFASQLHNAEFEESREWKDLTQSYLSLCKFYNAAGFDDMILRAATALKERPELIEFDHFIIDEYQDFNLSEQRLIDNLVGKAKNLLIVGDDEQVLYENLKSGTPTLIRGLYINDDYGKGMLPFCGRSSFHITKSAGGFIQQSEDEECIKKIYLPIRTEDAHPKVQVVACATPSTAADYIMTFIADYQAEIDDRKAKLENGEAKDAFLLILTPDKKIKFYREAAETIKETADLYRTEIRAFSEDYYKLLSYYSLAKYPHDNFTFRKVLYYEEVAEDVIMTAITSALAGEVDFCELESNDIRALLIKSEAIRDILENGTDLPEKLLELSQHINFDDVAELQKDIERKSIIRDEVVELGHVDEEEAELEELEVKKMGAVELMSIVGSKGLSADHVIIIGFDDVNMAYVTRNAFYVATTRPRNSLHLLTALRSNGATGPSAYLDQLPIDHIEFYKYKKRGREKSLFANKRAFKTYLSSLGNYRR